MSCMLSCGVFVVGAMRFLFCFSCILCYIWLVLFSFALLCTEHIYNIYTIYNKINLFVLLLLMLNLFNNVVLCMTLYVVVVV